MKPTRVQQYNDGRWGFDDYSSGQRVMVRLNSKEKAQSRATDMDVLMAKGGAELVEDFNAADYRDYQKWKAARVASPLLTVAAAEYVAFKKPDVSTAYAGTLKSDLKLFSAFVGSDRLIGKIEQKEIQYFLDDRNVSRRRRYNLRGAIVGLFRWARRRNYLDRSQITEAELVDPIKMGAGEVNVLTADQMRILIENIQERFLPWLLIGGFAGIRSLEIKPDRNSKKSPLMWEDFNWKHKMITMRAATTKTNRGRDVPLLPNLAEWLAPWRNAKGPVITCAELPNARETRRVGKLIGGWPHNCLRDSFCSYRTRITQSVHQTSYEMGNSVEMVNRSYHLIQPIAAAKEWFSIRPEDAYGKVVRISEKSIKKVSKIAHNGHRFAPKPMLTA